MKTLSRMLFAANVAVLCVSVWFLAETNKNLAVVSATLDSQGDLLHHDIEEAMNILHYSRGHDPFVKPYHGCRECNLILWAASGEGKAPVSSLDNPIGAR